MYCVRVRRGGQLVRILANIHDWVRCVSTCQALKTTSPRREDDANTKSFAIHDSRLLAKRFARICIHQIATFPPSSFVIPSTCRDRERGPTFRPVSFAFDERNRETPCYLEHVQPATHDYCRKKRWVIPHRAPHVPLACLARGFFEIVRERGAWSS